MFIPDIPTSTELFRSGSQEKRDHGMIVKADESTDDSSVGRIPWETSLGVEGMISCKTI